MVPGIVRALPVNTARGCIASCDFCYHVFKVSQVSSADSIVDEIRLLVKDTL